MASSPLSPLLTSTTMRMTGLATGLDTTSMVEQLMRAERIPLDKLNQKKTRLEWQKAANLEVNNLLRTFRDDFLSILKRDNYMLSADNIKANKVTMKTTTSAATITADRNAYAASHVIDSITSIATGANAASAAQVSSMGLTGNTSLGALALNTPLDFSDGALSFTINGSTFSFQSTDTLQTVLNRVNGDTDANVAMTYSSLTGKFTLRSKTTGSDSTLTMADTEGNFFAAIGMSTGTHTNGTNAVLSIDGISVTQKTNNFTIDGMNFSLSEPSATPINYSVAQDIDGAVTRIKSFVDSYNTLIGKLNEKINEKVYREYTPLTDEQRDAMDDDQIAKWEEKAKSGLLRNDSSIASLLGDMRAAFFDKVSSAGINAASIGLTTSANYSDRGKIELNEAVLRKALADNPDQVADVFTASSTSTDRATKYTQSGLATRIQTMFNNYLSDYTVTRSVNADEAIDDLEDSIISMTDRLTQREERYWKQFDALEAAMQRMNSQSAWLAQQFSANNSSY